MGMIQPIYPLHVDDLGFPIRAEGRSQPVPLKRPPPKRCPLRVKYRAGPFTENLLRF